MSEYFILYFKGPPDAKPVLKKWLLEEGKEIRDRIPLFSYQEGSQEKQFFSPVQGLFKVHLFKEGHSLFPDCEVAVLSVAEDAAKRGVEAKLGKLIKPEELDETIAHAQAASIRLPPE